MSVEWSWLSEKKGLVQVTGRSSKLPRTPNWLPGSYPSAHPGACQSSMSLLTGDRHPSECIRLKGELSLGQKSRNTPEGAWSFKNKHTQTRGEVQSWGGRMKSSPSRRSWTEWDSLQLVFQMLGAVPRTQPSPESWGKELGGGGRQQYASSFTGLPYLDTNGNMHWL